MTMPDGTIPLQPQPRDWSTCPYHAQLETTLREMSSSLASIDTEVKNQREDISNALKDQRRSGEAVAELQKQQNQTDGAIGVLKWLTVVGIGIMGLIVAAASAGAAYAQLAG